MGFENLYMVFIYDIVQFFMRNAMESINLKNSSIWRWWRVKFADGTRVRTESPYNVHRALKLFSVDGCGLSAGCCAYVLFLRMLNYVRVQFPKKTDIPADR